jgi:REP element-mobilizing transposase RayT
MPGKNTLKVYIPNHYYHVYNRGWNRTEIFCDTQDYTHFEKLIALRLSSEPAKDDKGREYMWLSKYLSLNAYCLMPNHFHMLLYQNNEDAIAKLLQSLCTAYTMYFNKKYKRRGPLMENRFKAVLITTDPQLQHITRYIHLNHKDFRTWSHSSYGDYISPVQRDWLSPKPILDMFDSLEQYKDFIADYETAQRDNDILKRSLADAA